MQAGSQPVSHRHISGLHLATLQTGVQTQTLLQKVLAPSHAPAGPGPARPHGSPRPHPSPPRKVGRFFARTMSCWPHCRSAALPHSDKTTLASTHGTGLAAGICLLQLQVLPWWGREAPGLSSANQWSTVRSREKEKGVRIVRYSNLASIRFISELPWFSDKQFAIENASTFIIEDLTGSSLAT